MAVCDVSKSGTRPNIRIEIHNNVMAAMDVDEGKLSEGEEGEIIEESVDFDDIIDDKITYPTRPTQNKKNRSNDTRNAFTEDSKKQAERAKRFQLEDSSIKQIDTFTNEHLESLHESMGITAENEKQVCFDTLHLHGTDKMNSHDVLEYFRKFTPVSVEWVNKTSCNVIFHDDVSSAEALFFMSKRVSGMPLESSEEDENRGRSVLLRNNNSNTSTTENEANISDINIPIPPGYWRLGSGESESTLLLRFAMFSDRKALMSESKKALFRGIFDRNKDIESKNPWGDLAKSWNRDKKTEEVAEPIAQPAPQMKHRLGFKRSQAEAFDEPEDEKEEKHVGKTKIPRMRMYADEEEAKIKRKKALDAIKRAANPKLQLEKRSNDLRSVIRGNNRENHEEVSVKQENYVDEIKQQEDTRSDDDLGNKLMNRRLKFTNPVPLTIYRKNEDVRQRLDASKTTKQHRFRDELLRSKRLKSPPPPQEPRYSKPTYEDEDSDVYSDDEEDLDVQTNSKVTVVIKKPKQPTVASTVWSRVNTGKPSVKDRVEMSRNPRSRRRESSESSDESTDEDSSQSSTDEKMENGESDGEIGRSPLVARPGFRDSVAEKKTDDHKKPLRIEISNDLFKK